MNNGSKFQTGYIPDGYTLDGFIDEVRGQHPTLSFKYRPIRSQDRAVIQDRIQKAQPSKSEEIKASAIASSVIEWDLETPDGEPVSLETKEILKCQPTLTDSLYLIVAGFAPTGINPEWNKAERDQVADDELEKALGGVNANEEIAVKN